MSNKQQQAPGAGVVLYMMDVATYAIHWLFDLVSHFVLFFPCPFLNLMVVVGDISNILDVLRILPRVMVKMALA